MSTCLFRRVFPFPDDLIALRLSVYNTKSSLGLGITTRKSRFIHTGSACCTYTDDSSLKDEVSTRLCLREHQSAGLPATTKIQRLLGLWSFASLAQSEWLCGANRNPCLSDKESSKYTVPLTFPRAHFTEFQWPKVGFLENCTTF